MGHVLDRVQDEHDIVTQGIDVILGELGYDLVQDTLTAAGKCKIAILLHAVQGDHRLVEGLFAHPLHLVGKLNCGFQPVEQSGD